MKSFACLLQRLVIWQVSEYFVDVDARLNGVLIKLPMMVLIDMKPQFLDRKCIKGRFLVCLGNICGRGAFFCCDLESNKRKQA